MYISGQYVIITHDQITDHITTTENIMADRVSAYAVEVGNVIEWDTYQFEVKDVVTELGRTDITLSDGSSEQVINVPLNQAMPVLGDM